MTSWSRVKMTWVDGASGMSARTREICPCSGSTCPSAFMIDGPAGAPGALEYRAATRARFGPLPWCFGASEVPSRRRECQSDNRVDESQRGDRHVEGAFSLLQGSGPP